MTKGSGSDPIDQRGIDKLSQVAGDVRTGLTAKSSSRSYGDYEASPHLNPLRPQVRTRGADSEARRVLTSSAGPGAWRALDHRRLSGCRQPPSRGNPSGELHRRHTIAPPSMPWRCTRSLSISPGPRSTIGGRLGAAKPMWAMHHSYNKKLRVRSRLARTPGSHVARVGQGDGHGTLSPMTAFISPRARPSS